MASSGIPPSIAASRPRPAAASGERRLRLALAGLLLYWLSQASAGLAWDIAWHTFIGRDSFLTPPHVLLYSGVAGAGLTCLAAVLAGTWQHRGRPATADRRSTVSLLGLFHAPLGFFVAGCGMLVLLVAAPLDNYWHELYGLDVTLWAPFHVMGLVGGVIGVLGLVYVLAAEDARTRPVGARAWAPVTVVTLFALSNLLRGLVVIFQPAEAQSPTIDLGGLQVLTLPVGLAFAVSFVCVSAAVMTRLSGAAAATAALAAAFATTLALIAPALVREAAAAGGYTFRSPAGPRLQGVDVLLPAALLLPALVVEALRPLLRSGALIGLACAAPAALIGTAVPLTLARAQPAAAVALGLALALPAGALGGWLGDRLGTVWRWHSR